MRTTRPLFFLALGAIAHAQPGWLMSGTGTLSNGVMVKVTSVAEPPLNSSQPLKIKLMGISGGQDRIHRSLIDDASASYFGYDLMAAPTGANGYQVTILPLTPAPNLAGLKPVALSKIPAPQMVREGDTVALDLLVGADGKQKIVDYIQISMRQRPPAGVAAPASAIKDYSIDDGPLHFDVQGEHEIFINGLLQSSPGLTGKSGATLWFYFPGQGRYILSLEPRIGYRFEAMGTIQDNVIRFQADGNRYEVRFPSPLISGGGAYRLYVLRDPAYRPPKGAESVTLGGIDRLENLVAMGNLIQH